MSGSQVVAVIEPDASRRLHKGSLVKMRMAELTTYGIVSGLSIPVPAQTSAEGQVHLAELELIGEARPTADPAPAARFRRGISAFPALGDAILPVIQDDLACVYASSASSTVRIGTVHLNQSQPVLISPDDLLGKHFAILGTTGCGKSCAVAPDPAPDPRGPRQRPRAAARSAQRVCARLPRPRPRSSAPTACSCPTGC